MYETLLKTPFLRLAIPFLTGTIVSYYSSNSWIYAVAFVLGVIPIVIFYLFPVNQYRYRHLPGTGINCLLFCFACVNIQQKLQQTEWNYSPQLYSYQVKILDDPLPKARTFQYSIQIKSIKTEEGNKPVNKTAMLYLPKDSLSAKLVAGDFLYVKVAFNKILNAENESSSGYSNFLKNKGYACTGYTSSNNWELMTPVNSYFPDIQSKALACRRYLLKKLKQIIPDENQSGLAAGILFGYKNTLNDELKTAFTTTGGAHILAVSGLHVGILYSILFFPFGFLGNTRKIKCMRQLIILPLMWIFAFITGLSPSVVRATTMLSFYGLGEIIGKKSFSLNIVGASAFLMLIYNPLYIFDIGFQLSFAAVISIITLNPLLQNLYNPKHYISRYIWSLLTISTVAQIGTAPLSIYYFNQFPIVFLLTNLFVIPLTGLTLISLIIYLSFACVFTLPEISLYPLHILLQFFISGVKFITTIPYACIYGLHIGIIDTVSLYLACYFITMLLIKKKIVHLYLLSLLALFQVIHYL